jgi:hypothetical protein
MKMRNFTAALTFAVTVLGVSLCGQDATNDFNIAAPRPSGRGLTPRTHPDRQVMANHGESGTSSGGPAVDNQRILYHGGPVVTGLPNIYFIWYGTTSSSTMTVLTDAARGLTNSSWARIDLSYHDASGTPASSGFVLKQAAYDLAYSLGKTITDSQVRDLVFAQIRAGKLPLDVHGLYFLFTAADVNITSGFGTEYCGYHTFDTLSNTPIRYALVGNPEKFGNACMEQTTKSPNDNPPADGMVSVFAHELTEMITDPYLNAWYDGSGQNIFEDADKCAWTFGSTFRAPNGSLANVALDGRDYLIQRNWVNSGAGYCGLAY